MHSDQEGACNARGEESNGVVTNSVTQGRQLSLAGSLDCSPWTLSGSVNLQVLLQTKPEARLWEHKGEGTQHGVIVGLGWGMECEAKVGQG